MCDIGTDGTQRGVLPTLYHPIIITGLNLIGGGGGRDGEAPLSLSLSQTNVHTHTCAFNAEPALIYTQLSSRDLSHTFRFYM